MRNASPREALGEEQPVPQRHAAQVVRDKGQRDRVVESELTLVVGQLREAADQNLPEPRRATSDLGPPLPEQKMPMPSGSASFTERHSEVGRSAEEGA